MARRNLFNAGQYVQPKHVMGLRVCDEREVMAALYDDHVEIQVLGIGVCSEDSPAAEANTAYMYLDDPVQIPLANFEWRNDSSVLDQLPVVKSPSLKVDAPALKKAQFILNESDMETICNALSSTQSVSNAQLHRADELRKMFCDALAR